MPMYKDILLNTTIYANGMSWSDAKVLEKVLGEARLPTFNELKIISASGKRELYSGHKSECQWFWTADETPSDHAHEPHSDHAYAVNFSNGIATSLSKKNECSVRYIRGTTEDVYNWCFDFYQVRSVHEKLDQILKNTALVRAGKHVQLLTNTYSDKVTVMILDNQKEIAFVVLEKEAFLILQQEVQHTAKKVSKE